MTLPALPYWALGGLGITICGCCCDMRQLGAGGVDAARIQRDLAAEVTGFYQYGRLVTVQLGQRSGRLYFAVVLITGDWESVAGGFSRGGQPVERVAQ